MSYRSGLVGAVAGLLVLAAACTGSGEGGREVTITQRDDGCTPLRIEATPGEKLKLVVKNEASDDYEVEGIEGTKLEEVVVPKGKTREPGYNVPDGDGTYKIKCYVPAGPSTIIEVVAGAGGAAGGETPEAEATAGSTEDADDTVQVGLIEFSITADKTTVKAGKIAFTAKNTSTSQVHELAVLKKDGEDRENMGEIEDIAAGAGGTVVLDLAAGDYELACLIVPGEAGSTADHYQEGMKLDFTVE